ncbi:MAG: von Willebrand factor type A domain-containing protein [candidate division Zixibacteria bacterium]|nr:von Willebrand factor type A domain-containing protein [candidate division Zixibacteria bacterium]
MHPKRITIALATIIPVLIIANALIYAAATGRIEGRITDEDTGKPIAGALVLVIDTQQVTMTDTDGKYVIKQLKQGLYSLRITKIGYNTEKINNIAVSSDNTTEVSLRMGKTKSEKKDTISIQNQKDELIIHETSNQQTTIRDGIYLNSMSAPSNLKKQGMSATALPPQTRSTGYHATGFIPPSHGGNAIVNGEAYDAMFFENYGVNPFVDTEDDNLSTFAIDVDDASYVMTRSYLDRGHLPPNEAVRVEEFVNHFDYSYEPPHDAAFDVIVEGAPSRFGYESCKLIKIGIKGRVIIPENRKPANLIFVVDVSGSMSRENRLGLVRKSLRLLLDELTPNDRVGIVVYGSTGRVIMEPTGLENKFQIERAIERLTPGGSTNAEEGLKLGYEMAKNHFNPSHINRIILCSDGVANVGRTGAADILKQIKKYADKGITLTTIGFGMGNFNDVLMEKLGNKGNGSYAYVDRLPEARRVFVENLTGMLQVIARDVKIQVDFNPEVVRSYRLLGYENRDVDDDKFRDDKEDGGEIGAGHEVTALYEIKLHKDRPQNKLGMVYVRYKNPDATDVLNAEATEISYSIPSQVIIEEFDNQSCEFKLAAAAAEFSEILRKSYWAKGSKLDNVLTLVKEIMTETDSPEVVELMSLISKAEQYKQQITEK